MGVSKWFRQLLVPADGEATPAAPSEPGAPAEPGTTADSSSAEASSEPEAPLPKRSKRRHNGPVVLDRDWGETDTADAAHEALRARIVTKLDAGKLAVSHLPATSLEALSMANRPAVEIRELADTIGKDPLLTSELLRVANSVLFSTQQPATSVQQAVMRIGLRSVRGVVFAAALKHGLSTGGALSSYGDEVGRQAQSVARVARSIAGGFGFDPEQAYVIGLLHDLGKLALLGLLECEVRTASEVTPEFVGRVFQDFHERAGTVMAQAWKLPDELVAIAGCHHDLAANTTEPRGAALAWLAHRIDLCLSLGDLPGFESLIECAAFEVLGTPEEARGEILDHARHAWEATEEALATRR